jgi:DNA repair protein REV1
VLYLAALIHESDYLKSSRLHKLSTWKAELTESLTRDMPPLSPDKHVIDKSGTRIYAYIDMDAFFATVSLRNRPDLRDKPGT